MKHSIPFEAFTCAGGLQLTQQQDGSVLAIFPQEGGTLSLTGEPMRLGGVDWSEEAYIAVEVTMIEDFDLSLVMKFSSKDPESLLWTTVNTGILPGIRTVVSIPLKAVHSNQMFYPRTPGKLKQIVLGRGLELEQVESFIITTRKCHQTQRMVIYDIYITDEAPAYKLDMPPILDTVGQLKTRSWKGKCPSEEEMIEKLCRELAGCQEKQGEWKGWSRYGGDRSVQYEAAGFFRTHYDGKRWFLVDPEGYRFLSVGLDCCIPGEFGYIEGIENLHEWLPDPEEYKEAYGESKKKLFQGRTFSYQIVNLMKAFGKDWKANWEALTRERLVRWNFNTIGNWSDEEFVSKAKIPYVWPMKDFPTTEVRIFRDFPDVFSKEYEENSEIFAQQLIPKKEDKYLIGYFMRNEPEWAVVQNLSIAAKMLENPAQTASKLEFIKRLEEKYSAVEALNAAWQTAFLSFDDLLKPQANTACYTKAAKEDLDQFSREMIRRYVAVPSIACRKADENHMNLGMRYAFLVDPVLLEGHEYFDVFSINCYFEDAFSVSMQAGKLIGKPVIIGEFHFGAPDAGMPAAGVSSVLTQRDRGLAYQEYFVKSLKSPYFVGAHYFCLNDQAALGRYDGENLQSGFVDVCQQPYETALELVSRLNRDIYEIADGRVTLEIPEIHRIPRLQGF